VLQYWVPRGKVNPGVWIAVFLIVITLINECGVRLFGEIEFWLSTVKVLVILGITVQTTRDLDTLVHLLSLTDISRLQRAGTIASIFSVVVGLLTWVVWPLPLYRDYIFTKPVRNPFKPIDCEC
jgi:L-asparagine transporter-like permease